MVRRIAGSFVVGFFSFMLAACVARYEERSAGPAWAADERLYQNYNQPVAAICALQSDGGEPHLIAAPLAPGARAEAACPPGSAYAGFQYKANVRTVRGQPAPEGDDEEQTSGEGK